MPIHFDFYTSPNSENTPDGKKYHARVVGGRTIEEKEIVDVIQYRSSLTTGDIKAVLSELHSELVTKLLDGNRVHLPGIGYFYLSLSAPKDADPEHTHSQSVKVKGIEFRADQKLKDEILLKAELTRARNKNHSSSMDIYEVDALLIDYFAEHNVITRKQLEVLCGFTTSTAQAHLRRLVKEGRLVNINNRQYPIYEPVKGYYGKV